MDKSKEPSSISGYESTIELIALFVFLSISVICLTIAIIFAPSSNTKCECVTTKQEEIKNDVK